MYINLCKGETNYATKSLCSYLKPVDSKQKNRVFMENYKKKTPYQLFVKDTQNIL